MTTKLSEEKVGKKELSKSVYTRLGRVIPQTQIDLILSNYHEVIQDNLLNNKNVILSGIGTLSPVMRRERDAAHPRTGEPIVVPPRLHIKFLCSERLLINVRTKHEMEKQRKEEKLVEKQDKMRKLMNLSETEDPLENAADEDD